ncbi:MarR family transcriptional regulator, partial [Escherichia coli]|uniref:MarR family winged helix-turn-helix transcriptional regulator n=1 Tax=Escherichia coli TaxID=562 RepID=UPI0023F7C7E1
PQNDVTLKMPAFEWVHVQLHQQKGMISLSPPTICNSAVLATSIGLSHAGTVRLIDRLEREQLVERRRQITDRRARFIHLTNSGKKITDALLKAREQVISECISPLSPNDLDILGMLSERLLVANGFDKDGSVSLCHLCGYSRIAPSRGKAKPGRSPRWNVASEG